jgi:hypothetical protein
MRPLIALTLIALASFSKAPQGTPGTPSFTFTVPVHVANIPPEVTRVVVICFVFNYAQTIGADTVTVPLTAGNFTGNITVPVAVSGVSGRAPDPSLVNRWGCGLQFRVAGGYNTPGSFVNPPGVRGTLRWDAAAGSTMTVQLQGSVP